MLSVLFRKESNVNGKLQFQGDLEIDGTFSGAVTTDDGLVIGENATVNAEINCGSVIVKGNVTGNITARDMVALESGSHVKGDIASPSLSVAKGARSTDRLVWGRSRRGGSAQSPRSAAGPKPYSSCSRSATNASGDAVVQVRDRRVDHKSSISARSSKNGPDPLERGLRQRRRACELE